MILMFSDGRENVFFHNKFLFCRCVEYYQVRMLPFYISHLSKICIYQYTDVYFMFRRQGRLPFHLLMVQMSESVILQVTLS